MLALAGAFIYGGYTFVYAAVANGGKLASNPWQAFYVDAYTGKSAGARSSSHPSLLDRILGAGIGVLSNAPVLGPLVGVFGG